MKKVNFKEILKSLFDIDFVKATLGSHTRGSKHENITDIGTHTVFIKYRPSKKVVVLRWEGKDSFIMQPFKNRLEFDIGSKKEQRELFQDYLKSRNIKPVPSKTKDHPDYSLFTFNKSVLEETEFLEAVEGSISDLISS